MRGGRWLAPPIALSLVPLGALLASLAQASVAKGEVNAVLLAVLFMWWPGVITTISWWLHPDAKGDLVWHTVKAFIVLGCTIIATSFSFLFLSIVVG